MNSESRTAYGFTFRPEEINRLVKCVCKSCFSTFATSPVSVEIGHFPQLVALAEVVAVLVLLVHH